MSIKSRVRNFLWKFGYDVCRFTPASHPIAQKKHILDRYGINVVLDIGANTGQFVEVLRAFGYRQRILSFEPTSAAFEQLQANAKGDPAWQVFQVAVGEAEATQEINIAGNSQSSSILNMLPAHLNSAPDSKYIGKESVRVVTLDSLFGDLCKPGDNVYMKIDTQGFERQVLKGAERSLPRIGTIQVEMSLVSLYEGELLFDEMRALLAEKGYGLVWLEPVFSDEASGRLLQVDGVFHRF